MKLYYHKTDGGAEYLCSSKVKGTEDEGSFDSRIIVRIDGDIEKDAELVRCEPLCGKCGYNLFGLTNKELKALKQ